MLNIIENKKTKIINKYIELQPTMYIEDYTVDVKYLGDSYDYNELIDFIKINQGITQRVKEFSFNTFFDFFEKNNYNKKALFDLINEQFEYLDDEELEKMSYEEQKEEISNYYGKLDFDPIQEITYYLGIVENEFIRKYLEYLGFQYGTIGYSNWSYYIALDDVEHEFIQDLWEGWNFYDIAILDDKGEYIDGLCCCYIRNNEELTECIKDNFGIKKEDIKLINNDSAEYFDYSKVSKIVKEYEFIEIK